MIRGAPQSSGDGAGGAGQHLLQGGGAQRPGRSGIAFIPFSTCRRFISITILQEYFFCRGSNEGWAKYEQVTRRDQDGAPGEVGGETKDIMAKIPQFKSELTMYGLEQ